MPFETIRAELEVVFAESYRASGVVFRYARQDRHAHVNSHTFYLGYEGPLPGESSTKEVKTDITIREEVVFPIEERPLLQGYEEYEDIPERAVIGVYSLREIAAEKTIALVDRTRNEPRDLYDLWYLTEHGHMDLNELTSAIARKLAFRGQDVKSLQRQLAAKEQRLRALWSPRLAGQMATLPEFDGVFRAVWRAFRQARLG